MSSIIGMGSFIMGEGNRGIMIVRTGTESAKTENFIGYGAVGGNQKENLNR